MVFLHDHAMDRLNGDDLPKGWEIKVSSYRVDLVCGSLEEPIAKWVYVSDGKDSYDWLLTINVTQFMDRTGDEVYHFADFCQHSPPSMKEWCEHYDNL